jgi:hypothetical protein
MDIFLSCHKRKDRDNEAGLFNDNETRSIHFIEENEINWQNCIGQYMGEIQYFRH